MNSSNPPSHTNEEDSANEEIAKALYDKDFALWEQGKTCDAIAAYDEVIGSVRDDLSVFPSEVTKAKELRAQAVWKELS